MVDKGYVERLEHPLDARQKLLGLTPRARRAMAAAHRFHGAFERALVERVGARQAAAVRAALEAIVLQAEARGPEGVIALRPL
jgi:DNA-binding MarR family transcriptional regulator